MSEAEREPAAARERLAAAVRAHRATGGDEQGHCLATLDFLARPGNPFDRERFDPGHATGSCFVVGDDGRAALVFHKRFLWVQPGGHAEPGELDAAAIAAREASEELGLAIDPGALELFDVDVHQIPRFGKTPAHLHFDLRFLAQTPSGELAPGSDAADARWFTRDELAAVGLDRGLRRMADKAEVRGLLRRDGVQRSAATAARQPDVRAGGS